MNKAIIIPNVKNRGPDNVFLGNEILGQYFHTFLMYKGIVIIDNLVLININQIDISISITNIKAAFCVVLVLK